MEVLNGNTHGWILHENRPNIPNPHSAVPHLPTGTSPASAKIPYSAEQKTTSKSFSLGRLVRVSIALVALGGLVWWLGMPLLFPITSRAVVNARTVQARSPIDGINAEMTRDVGDEVSAGESLLRVSNRQVDTSHLAEVKVRVCGLEAQQKRYTRELQEATAIAPVLRATVKRYQKAVLDCLTSSVQEAKARTESARVELDAALQRQKRLSTIRRTGGGTGAELDDAQEALSRSRKNLEKEQAVLTRLEGELKAAQQGLFLQNEASYSLKRADEVDQKIISLKASLKENTTLLAAARAQLTTEEQHLKSIAGVNVVSPVSGTVWKRPGNPGQVVKQNELVYEVADHNTIFVEALFHQRYLSSSLVPGSYAVINLTSGQRICGRVRAIRALGEADAETNYAVKLTSSDVKQVHVLIALDKGCADASLIGRHVRVLIVPENPSILARTVSWMFSCIGG